MRNSSPAPVRRPFFKLLYTLLLTAAALVWLMQNSISNYWLEVYHRDPGIPAFQSSALWQTGGELQRDWMHYQDAGSAALHRFDDAMRERINQTWLTPPRQAQQATVRGMEARPARPASEAAAPPAAAVPAPAQEPPSTVPAETVLDAHEYPWSVPPEPAALPESGVLTSLVRDDTMPLKARHNTLDAWPAGQPDAAPDSLVAASRNAGPAAGIGNEASRTTTEEAGTSAPPDLFLPPPPQVLLQAGDTVFFVGDSMMQGVAPHVRKQLFKEHGIESLDLSKQSSGLAYTGFFNWPATVEQTLTSHPDIRLMVVFLGPNDPWDFPLARGQPFLRFKSPEWEAAYRERIRALLESAREHQVHVMWLEVPAMKKNSLNQSMDYLNTLYASEVAHAGAQFIPTNLLLGNENAAYSTHVQVGDRRVKVRIDDGIHFTVAGQRLIAEAVLARIDVLPAPDAAQ